MKLALFALLITYLSSCHESGGGNFKAANQFYSFHTGGNNNDVGHVDLQCMSLWNEEIRGFASIMLNIIYDPKYFNIVEESKDLIYAKSVDGQHFAGVFNNIADCARYRSKR